MFLKPWRQANPLGLRVAEAADFCFAECHKRAASSGVSEG